MMSIGFAAVGFAHNHIYSQTDALLAAGATLLWYLDDGEPEQVTAFEQRYPQARPARVLAEILEDPRVALVVSAAVPDERAPLGIETMRHGKDFLCAKPGFTTLQQLAEAREVQAASARHYAIYFGERFGNAATVHAGELVHAGAIGEVIQTVGFGPHRLGHVSRPAWTFERARYGGILNDLASHQIDQFLYFAGKQDAEIVTARTANLSHPHFPTFEDFGELLLQSGRASGYVRVDWFTPDGLNTWGDVRLFIQGTEGYIEVRKNCDIGGRAGDNHLFLVDGAGVRYLDCSAHALPFAAHFLDDVATRSETAVTQAHTFTVSELALRAQAVARG